MEEEWYAEQTVIWHNGSKGDKLEKARGCQLGTTRMVHQAQLPGSSTMCRSPRQLLVLDPDEIDPDIDTLWGEDDQTKYLRCSVMPFIPT